MRRSRIYSMLVLLVALAAPAAASGGTSPRADLLFRFATARPATQTGLHLYVLYKDPADPNGKPPAVRHLDIAVPPGTRFDLAAAPACGASDAELMALGDSACPAASRLGGGSLTVDTGVTPFDPVATDVSVYGTATGWVELAKYPNTGRPVGTDRVTVASGHLIANPAFDPGAPPDGTVVRKVDFTFTPPAGWLVTPAACADTWTTRANFGFADGATQVVEDSMPCERRAAAAPRRPGRRPRRTARHRRRHHRHPHPSFAG